MVSPEALRFVIFALTEMSANGVEFDIVDDKFIVDEDGFKLGGYFSAGFPSTFGIAVQNPYFLGNFVHEYCHYLQTQDEAFIIDEEITDFNEWLSGRYISRRRLVESVRAIQACELDCEQRAVQLITEKRLTKDLDVSEYIKLANCYVLLYNVCLMRRQWMNERPISKIPELKALVPSTWLTDYTVCPPGFVRIASRECFVPLRSKCSLMSRAWNFLQGVLTS